MRHVAEVNDVHRYQAYCSGCAWWGEELESESAAEVDVAEHNQAEHS